MSDNTPDHAPELDLKDLVSKVDFGSMFDEKVDRKQVNFWISETYGERFLAIQKKTRYKFGRKLVELIELCVDMAEASEPPPKRSA